MDPDVSMTTYGLVVAADAFAQMIASPTFGIIADKMNQVRLVCLICTITFCGGNVLYSLVRFTSRENRFT